MRNYFFTKLSGAGNDFILFDKRLNPDLSVSEEFIKKICHRNTGIGADGVLLISDSSDADFNLNYFNADGTTGSLCANGSRCAIYYAYKFGYSKNNEIKFIFNNEFYFGEVIDNENVKFHLHSPSKIKLNFRIKAFGQLIKASFVDTGSPHVVIFINDFLKNEKDLSSFYDDLNEFPVLSLGKEIRYHKDFEPNGVNVNFLKLENDICYIRTYERGVENETLSCGTGTVASAIILNKIKNNKPPLKFLAKSGDILIVDFAVENNEYKKVSLTGPAKVIFKGEITL
ncbi:MAG: diaminopimelate epimerase [Melioribacteraceae bacterium]|nr:diaminopimelate epimerase [Melioribacteraceae bacterium]